MKNKISAIIFIIFIGIFSIGSFVLPDRTFSDMENRNLQQMPELTLGTFLDGTFSGQFETYMADQMMGKDAFVSLKVDTVRTAGQKLVNGVFFGKDGYLIQKYDRPGEQLDKNIGFIKSFAESCEIPVTLMVVPNASEIYPEKLPMLTECYSQELVIKKMKEQLSDSLEFVDATENLKTHRDEGIYFKTDHHWTMLGAYYGYEALCDSLELGCKPLSAYKVTRGSDTFYGSLYSKAPSMTQRPDVIDLYENTEGSYEVTYVQKNYVTNDVFERSNLNIKDKYTVFMNGNHPLVTVKSNGVGAEKVLVIKDSYGHALLPFLADTYADMHIVDLRYFHEDMKKYIVENEFDRVIFIHNVDFVSSDQNFLWLD